MLDNMAITERDIFCSLIAPEKLDRETELEYRTNINKMLDKVPFNIFKNEYFVIYEAIRAAKTYNVILSYKHFNQIILNNLEKLINMPNINLEEIVTDINDIETSKEEFINICCLTYEELSNADPCSSRFEFNLDLYIKSWTATKLNELLVESYKINTEGKKIGKDFLQGPEDADAYYLRQSAKIKQMFNLGEKKLSSLLVNPEGYQKYIEDRDRDMAIERIAYTGMEYIDEEIGELGRGTLLVVQGPPGGGKTRLSTNIAYSAIINGENGVIFALEGHPRRALSLIIARHLVEKYNCSDVDDDMIFKKTYPPEYAELVEAAEYDIFNNESYGRFVIVPSPVFDDEIENILEEIWDTKFEFSWVVLDYGSLVRSRKNESVTTMLTNLMPKLETSCQSFRGKGFLLIMPHQLTRDSIKGLIKGETVGTILGSADSSSVMKSAHIALTIYTDDELKMRDMAQIICTKSRHTEGFPAREVYAKLGVCFFADLPE